MIHFTNFIFLKKQLRIFCDVGRNDFLRKRKILLPKPDSNAEMISLRATNECIKMPFILDDHFHDINFTGNTQVAGILEKYKEGGGEGW
jgi:hypothetical protein